MISTVTIIFLDGNKLKIKKVESVGFGEGMVSLKKGNKISYYPTSEIVSMEQVIQE